MSPRSSDLLQTVDRIASDVVARHAVSVDIEAEFPAASVGALAQAGALGALSAEDVGGQGLGLRAAAQIVERVARECGSTAMVLVMHFCGAAVIEKYGPEKIRRQVATGEHLSTLAFSEAGSRSHFWVPVSTAAKKNGHIVLDAEKSWVTSAHKAAAYVWSSKPVAAEGLSTIWLVPSDRSGLTVEGEFNGLGLRGNDSSPVRAIQVEIPESNRLGEDGRGFDIMMQDVLPVFQILSTACSAGLMEGATQRTASHTGRAYGYTGAKLAELPTIRNYIARMRTKTDMVHALLQDTLHAIENGRPDAMLRVLESKAAAGETSTEVLDLAMRVCGGQAFRKDVGVERYFRDGRAAGVMAPTTDVLYDFIGKAACGMELF